MSENKLKNITTGSRNDLQLHPSRCLRMRFSGSSCSRCADICPHGAINLENALAVDQNICRGCLLCSTACPSGALEQGSDFSECLSRLSKVPEPVLGCVRTQEHSNANITCLGGLSEEHLIAIYALQVQQVQLDLATCSGCSNENAVKLLRGRLDDLGRKIALPIGGKIKLVEQAAELNFLKETIGRRGFFKALTGSLLKETSTLLQSAKTPDKTRVAYTEKQLPQRKTILNLGLKELPELEQQQIRRFFKREAVRSENCDGCAACSKVCTTGAMTEKTDGESNQVEHDPLHCTGCGLCVEFCLNEALQLKNGFKPI